MRPFFGLLSATLAHVVVSTRTPLLPYDPNTTKDCAEWHNVGEDQTCEYVRKYYGITPAEFHEWNPAIGVGCTPWYEYTSYCIVTWKKLATLGTSTTSSSVMVSSTTSALPLAPSPTAWDSLGCYSQNAARPIVEQNMNPNGDASLTIPKCKNTCYRRAYTFAGVQSGNQCWCSNFVGGEWAKNQTDCNTPCTGDKNTICGGSKALNVFEALANSKSAATSSVSKPAATTKASPTPNSAVRMGF